MVGKAGASGTNRNPEKYCHAMRSDGVTPCGAYALKGLTVCRAHGGATPNAQDYLAKAEVVKMAGMLDIPAPVNPEDFPKVASEYVGFLNQVCSGLLADLRRVTADETGVDVARKYGDILDRINATAMLVTKMMDSVARLKLVLPPPAPPKPMPIDEIRRMMEGVQSRMVAAYNLCPTCMKPNIPVYADQVVEDEPADNVVQFRPDFI